MLPGRPEAHRAPHPPQHVIKLIGKKNIQEAKPILRPPGYRQDPRTEYGFCLPSTTDEDGDNQ